MDKYRISSLALQAKGGLEDAAGKATGDTKMEGEEEMDKAKSKVQNTAGGLKDKAREALDDK